MNEQIESLTPEQAQRALLMFYDLLPSTNWEDGNKPSSARMDALADRLLKNSPEGIQPFLGSLHTGNDPLVRGETARVVLQQFAQIDALAPYVTQAMTRSLEPHMMIDPISIGAIVIVLLAALSAQGRIKTPGGVEINFKGGAPAMLEQLAKVLKELPDVLKALPETAEKQIASMLHLGEAK